MAFVVLVRTSVRSPVTTTVSISTPREFQLDRGSRTLGSTGTGAIGPVLHDPRATGLTYEPFYGFREKPFSLTSDSRFFYHSRSHAPAFADLVAGIRRRESLNVLSGDIGTGKTTLCRAVLNNLDRKTFSAFVPDPFASREDLLKVLLVDFGVASVDDMISGRLKGASRTELSYLLYEFLGTLAPLQAFAVVIIDEAQNLSNDLLEEVRILADADGQLQVVLVGQLELREKLKQPEMRQLDQRVSVHCTLEPLGLEGVTGYVDHRLYAAGGSRDRIRFSDDAIEAVYRVSGGLPRIINRVCDRALHHGYLKRASTIDLAIFEAAIPNAMQVAAPAQPPRARAESSRIIPQREPNPGPPPDSQGSDPLDVWLAQLDTGKPAKAAPQFPSSWPGPADVMRPDEWMPAEPSVAPRRRPGFVLRAGPPRTAVERITDKWLRGLGVATVALTLAATALLGAPTMLDVSNALLAASTDLLSPPEKPTLPPEPPAKVAAPLAMPAAPDVLAPDVASAVSDKVPSGT
jgi:type II secretory pathway predicted ATPase ExeA